MTKEEFRQLYPNLTQALEIVSTENEMPWNEEILLPPFLTPSLEAAEKQAVQLSLEELETIAMGEDDAREELVKSTGFVVLDDLLTEAFEGIISDAFWHP